MASNDKKIVCQQQHIKILFTLTQKKNILKAHTLMIIIIYQ